MLPSVNKNKRDENTKYPNIPKSSIYIKGSKIQWGEMQISEDHCSFIFTIKNYSLLNKKNGESVCSPTFSMEKNDNIKWHLELFPEGQNDECDGFISYFLCKDFDIPESISVRYFVSIIDKNNENYETLEEVSVFTKDTEGWGESNMISNEDLYAKKDILLPDDTLTLFCSIVIGESERIDSKTISIEEYNLHANKKIKLDNNPANDSFEKMYKDDTYSDITLIVENKEIKAHKCLLSAASPILAMNFKKGAKKVASKSIVIADFSYEVINELVRFIYTKSVQNLQDIADELLKAANKYLIQDLKNMCVKALGEKLNSDNINDMINIAEMHDAEELKKLILEYVIKNKNELKLKPGFKEMIEAQPKFMKELLWF